jgi:hypothetical protein
MATSEKTNPERIEITAKAVDYRVATEASRKMGKAA